MMFEELRENGGTPRMSRARLGQFVANRLTQKVALWVMPTAEFTYIVLKLGVGL